jgi:GT2 family glycosyltransferase
LGSREIESYTDGINFLEGNIDSQTTLKASDIFTSNFTLHLKDFPIMSQFNPVLVSIVIVSWNTANLLRTCLEAIRLQTTYVPNHAIETIVVDNSSSDGSADIVQTEFPEVKLIKNAHNYGFARGTNQGVQVAHGDYVLFLNPDTQMFPGSLKTLIEFMELNPKAGAAGARLLNEDGSLQQSAYPDLTLLREFWRLFHLDQLYPLAIYPLSQWNPQKAHPVDVVQGACLILRREVIEEVGLLDEDYFMYTEEVDLCHRLHHAGWGVYWVPGAEVLHYGDQSTRQRKTEMFLMLYESKILFFRKHHGLMAANIYKGILGLACLPRLLMEPLAWLLGTRERKQQKELANKYLRLLRALPTM